MARRVAAWLRETQAFLTQARYLPQDVRVSHRIGAGPTIVFLHGLYASGGVWRPLRRRVERELHASTHSLSYVPGVGIEALTDRLQSLIAGIEQQQAIHLVGHSFGGLVMRNYVSRAACDARVVGTISLAAPFLGTLMTGWVPGQGSQDLLPDSAILARLRENSAENLRVPHLSLNAAEDHMIVPGAFPDYGEHILIAEAGHNGILFHEQAMQAVLQRVASLVART